MFSQIGAPGIILLLVVCLIIFGSKNLPQMGKSLGESIKEFKDGMEKGGERNKGTMEEIKVKSEGEK